MIRLSLIGFIFLWASVARGQAIGRTSNATGSGAPTGSCVSGTSYTDTATGHFWTCTSSAWTLAPFAQQINPNQNVFYVSSNCGTQTNCFNTSWNTRQVTDCGNTSGSAIVTCTGSSFTSSDIGKTASLFGNCQVSFQANFSNPFGNGNVTISSVQSATQVTLSTTSSATTTASASTCFVYGTPDDTALAAADSAAQSSPVCIPVVLPAGIGLALSPHFYTNPASCVNIPGQAGGSLEVFGFEVKGEGPYSSLIWMPPNFGYSSCTHGASGHACWGGMQAYFHDWSLQGFGFYGSGISTTANILEGAPNTNVNRYFKLQNFACENLASAAPNVVGFLSYPNSYHTTFQNVNFDGCGAIGAVVDAQLFLFNSSIQDSVTYQVSIGSAGLFAANCGGPTATCYFISTAGDTAANPAISNQSGGIAVFTGAEIANYGTSASYAYRAAGASTTISDGAFFYCSASSSCNALFQQNAGIIRLHATTIYSPGQGLYTASGTGATVYDECGNTFSAANNTITSGDFFLGACSFNTANLATGNLVLSANWGTSAATSAWLGANSPVSFTITNGSVSTGVSPTITYTFPTPFLVSPLWCNATQVGGTNAIGTFTSSSLSKTGVTFTYSLLPTLSDTETIQVSCALAQ